MNYGLKLAIQLDIKLHTIMLLILSNSLNQS